MRDYQANPGASKVCGVHAISSPHIWTAYEERTRNDFGHLCLCRRSVCVCECSLRGVVALFQRGSSSTTTPPPFSPTATIPPDMAQINNIKVNADAPRRSGVMEVSAADDKVLRAHANALYFIHLANFA